MVSNAQESTPDRGLVPWMVRRRLRKARGRGPSEPLDEQDWRAFFALNERWDARLVHSVLRALPSSPRCGICGAPFGGPGRLLVRPLGYRPSRKNPTICATCVESSPPGGTTTWVGLLFADVRGFTELSERERPELMSRLLRRFYGCAESVLFPEAIIDKVVGDQVMALYLPDLIRDIDRRRVPALMLSHAIELLKAVGYGTPEGPFLEIGIGLDAGEAYVGNIGERAVYDFTAIGTVVNTAARLEAQARSGEVLLSDRVAAELPDPPGEREELDLKGRSEPQAAYRVRA